MGLLDFFSNEAGQGRRKWMDDQTKDVLEALQFYAGPGVDVESTAGLLSMFNPVQDVGEAMRDTRDGDYVGAAANTLSALAPVGAYKLAGTGATDDIVNVVQDVLMGFGMKADAATDAGRRFAGDEFGGVGPGGSAAAPFDVTGGGGIAYGSNGGPRISSIESVNMPPHSRPEWSGAAPSRTDPYPRYEPAKTPARMQRMTERTQDPGDPIHGMFRGYIDKGKTLGGEDWYNTEELRSWFVDELGEKAGDQQWREYMELVGTTSTGAKVPENIRMASFYRALSPEDRLAVASKVAADGGTPAARARELGVAPANMPPATGDGSYNYGHLKQKNQASNVVNREQGKWDRAVPDGLTQSERTKWLQANPKVKGFGNDLLGDDTNIAADMHFMRMLAMSDGGGDFLTQQAKLSKADYATASQAIGPRNIKKYTTTRKVNGKEVSEVNLQKAWKDGYLKDTTAFKEMPTAWADTPGATEYAAYESMAKRISAEYGMTPAQFQASLWMGAGDMTNLADSSQGTFMELFRRSLDKRGGQMGLTREQMLREFIHNKAPLAIGGSALLGIAAQPQAGSNENGS